MNREAGRAADGAEPGADRAGEQQWQRYQPDGPRPEDRDRIGQPLDRPDASGGTTTPAAPTPSGSWRGALGVLLVVGAVITGIVVASSNAEDRRSEFAAPDELSYAPIVDDATWKRFVAAVEDELGDTEVVSLSLSRNRLYGDGRLEITVDAPPAEGQPLQVDYAWTGRRLKVQGGKEPYGWQPFDLAEVDPAVLVQVDELAWEELDAEVSSTSITLSHDEYDDRVEIESSLYDGDAYRSLRADLDGRVLESEYDDR